MSTVAVVNATVVHADRVGADECVVVEDGVVTHVGARPPLPSDCRLVDAAGDHVLPGLVDIHAHGALGRTFNEPDVAAWTTALDAHAASGTTSLVATLASDTPAAMAAAAATAQVLSGHAPLVGWHLEGPYLNPEFAGAHPAAALRTPADGSWQDVVPDATGLRLVTLAPELPGAADLVRSLVASGVRVAAGHSAARGEVLDAARHDGVRHVTHLWSGQSVLRKDGPWRTPGLLEETLGSADLTAEIIADGCHVPAVLARVAYRCLGPDRLCLVSDASAGTGLPAGTEFRMGAAHGTVADGVAVSADGTSFCGSTSFLSDVLRFAVRRAGIPLVDAVRMATATPARVAGIADRAGTLAPGRAADLVVLDHDLRVRVVAISGRWLTREEVATHG
jgi:N-acetylglucosamine-6-phosphate deacetylase